MTKKKFPQSEGAQQLSIIENVETSLTLHERNFFMLPLFFLSSKMVGSQEIIEKRFKTKGGEGLWRVSPNVELGMGGPFDDAVLVALNKYISALPKPITNPVDIGSLRGIMRMMGYSKETGSKITNMIKTSIKRMTALLITSKLTFYEKSTDRYLDEASGVFHIIDKAIFVNEVYEGRNSDRNMIWLNDNFLRNINARYVAPLDYDFYMSLKVNTSKAVVKLLTFAFYANRANRTPVTFKYSTICQRTTLTRRIHLSAAKQQILPALDELKDQEYLKEYGWAPIAGEAHDWYISFWPGERAQRYVKHSLPLYTTKKIDFAAAFEELPGPASDVHSPGKGATLFDLPAAPQATTAVIDSNINLLISCYEELFTRKYEHKPAFNNKRDRHIFAELLEQYSIDTIKDLLRLFLNYTDEDYVSNSGYTIPMFKTVLNKLIVKLQAEKRKRKKETPSTEPAHQPYSDITKKDIKAARERLNKIK